MNRRDVLIFLGTLPALFYAGKGYSAIKKQLDLEQTKVRGIYAHGWKGASKKNIDALVNLLKSTELNTIVVDVKNVRGELFYAPKTKLAKKINAQVKTKEGRKVSLKLDYLLDQTYKNNIKLIARHAMFWDNCLYTKKEDLRLWTKRSEKWVDLRKDEVLEYNLNLLDEESKKGFSEIALDYIRFPATSKFGKGSEKCEVIDKIVKKAGDIIRSNDTDIGVYVFGYTAWHHSKAGVGQRIGTLAPSVDVIYPMIYPSHFWEGSFGFENPSKNPYEFIEMGYNAAVKKIKDDTKIIPMLQAFNYSPREIKLQIDAAYDNQMPGYICWNPSSNYSMLKEALK